MSQSVIRLYAVPMTAFTTEDEEGEGYEGDEHESAA
jgi:translation initiation factor 3 subunit D